MKKSTIVIAGKTVNINTDKKNVAVALQALITALTERRFGIGMRLQHSTGVWYQLVRISRAGSLRAYLINENTGKARCSTKFVAVQTDDSDHPNGYVTDLPCSKDKFYDPDNYGEYVGDLS